MKSTFRNISFLAAMFCGQGSAQEVKTPPVGTVTAIPGVIQVAAPPEPAAAVEKPDFQIEGTQVKLIDVVESPPMPGLPPVSGTMTLKVHSVADPGLPDPPRPPESAISAGTEDFAEYTGEQPKAHFAFISATVYDRSRTRLTCYPRGGGEKGVTVWSNVDFNHFSEISAFEAKGSDGEIRSYHLMMGIGNETTEGRRELLAEHGIEWEMPEIPTLPDGPPVFVVESQDPDTETLELVEDLHALYRDEGKRMAELSAAREKAYEDKKAYLLANPPKPKDVTVHFWNRGDSSTRPEAEQP